MLTSAFAFSNTNMNDNVHSIPLVYSFIVRKFSSTSSSSIVSIFDSNDPFFKLC